MNADTPSSRGTDDPEHTPAAEQRAADNPARAGYGRTFVDGTTNDGADVGDDIDIDSDITDDYGFDPAVSASGAAPVSSGSRPSRLREGQRHRPDLANPGAGTGPGRRRGRRGLRRRIGAVAVLLGALAAMGSAYAAFATSSGAAGTDTSAQTIAAGRELYEVSCITCHGANLQGVQNQGVPLIGVGEAAAYFQMATGRMPVAGQGAEVDRKEAKFNEQQIEQISAYIQSVGGGPVLPAGDLESTAHDGIAEGGALFRLNCASCHGTTFKGAPLSGGKYAPSLNPSTDKEIYAAMLSGPESMPVFSDNQLTPTEKKQIIAYIQTIKASDDPGGSGIDRIGPVSEAIVIWVAGVGLLMVAILWIGARSR